MKFITNLNSLDDFNKIKRCVICDRKVYLTNRKICFCMVCWGDLPKKLRNLLKRMKKENNLDMVKKLTKKCYNILEIFSELKGIKSCLICRKKLGFFNSELVATGICTKCIGDKPEKWRDELVRAQKDKRYDQIKSLVDIAVQGDFDYEIEDLLVPKYGSFKYKGGHPDFSDFTEVSLTDKPNGVVAFDNDSKEIFFTIKWDNITNISADKEVVTKSSAGLSAVGLLAGRPDLTIMGAAWKNNKENNFLNIGYRHSDMETTISFEGNKAYEAAAFYISQVSKYREETTCNDGDSEKSIQISANPIDQIKKLAELKDAGILTEDEFKSKKEKLLSTI